MSFVLTFISAEQKTKSRQFFLNIKQLGIRSGATQAISSEKPALLQLHVLDDRRAAGSYYE